MVGICSQGAEVYVLMESLYGQIFTSAHSEPIKSSKMAQVVTLLTCIWEAGRQIIIRLLVGLLSLFRHMPDSTSILPSSPFQVLYSQLIFPLTATYPEVPRVTLYKALKNHMLINTLFLCISRL